jgi:hypothetical protein
LQAVAPPAPHTMGGTAAFPRPSLTHFLTASIDAHAGQAATIVALCCAVAGCCCPIPQVYDSILFEPFRDFTTDAQPQPLPFVVLLQAVAATPPPPRPRPRVAEGIRSAHANDPTGSHKQISPYVVLSQAVPVPSPRWLTVSLSFHAVKANDGQAATYPCLMLCCCRLLLPHLTPRCHT